MNSSDDNINFKNQNDNTDDELGGFDGGDGHNMFMNKKELPHIEDDTSINVDKSYDDDHSKSSTLKKGFIINNMSALNEQFASNNQIGQKKFENELHDVSGDFNCSGGVESFPLMMAGRMMRNNNINNNDEPIHMHMDGNEYDSNNENEIDNDVENNGENHFNNNINNDMILQQIKTKTDYNNIFTNQKELYLADLSSPKKKEIKNYQPTLEIEDIEDEDEEEDLNDNEGTNHQNQIQNLNQNNEEQNRNITNNNINNINSIQMILQNPQNKQFNIKSQTLNPKNSNNNINNNNSNKLIMAQKTLNPFQNNINIPNSNSNMININSNISNNNQQNNLPSISNNIKNFAVSNFNHCYLGNNMNKFYGSVNTSGQTFGVAQSIDFQNKYNQLESKYNQLLEQNKKLESECEELKNSDRGVLDMLTYWQNFYLEILEIVFPKKSKSLDVTKNDYLDDPYRIQTINEVKKLVLINRDKAYNIFYKSKPIQFDIITEIKEVKELIKKNSNSSSKKDIKKNNINSNSFNNSINNSNTFNSNNNNNCQLENWKKKIIYSKGESFSFKESDMGKKKKKKFLDEDDDLNFLPPIRHIEKINTGINTDISGDNVGQPIVKEVIKEVTVIQQVPPKKFDYNKLSISKKVKDKTSINYISKKKSPTPIYDITQSPQSKNGPKDVLLKAKPKSNKINNKNKTQENNNSNSNKLFNELKISQSMKMSFKGLPPKTPKKFKKNILHKIATTQTDMTAKNISSIETLNKACSSQLLNSQRDKEKMQKLYDDKIASLNDYISELDKKIKQNEIKSEKIKTNENSNNNTIKSNDNTIKSNDKVNNNTNNNTETSPNNLNNSFIFLPEMIPPENTYKIFMHCVKHFKYEEDIYKKYLEEEDLFILKTFVNKMEKYLFGTSLPVLKENNKKMKRKEKSDNNLLAKANFDHISKKDIIISHKIKDNQDNNIIIHENNKNFATNNIQPRARATSDKKNSGDFRNNSVYGNSNTFNKYKAAIMTLKNY